MATTPISGKAGSFSVVGDNLVLTPSTGNRLRVFYVAVSANGANSDTAITASVRFGSNDPLYIFSLLAGSMIARNIGAGGRHLQGGLGESLIINLSSAGTIHVSVEYDEVP